MLSTHYSTQCCKLSNKISAHWTIFMYCARCIPYMLVLAHCTRWYLGAKTSIDTLTATNQKKITSLAIEQKKEWAKFLRTKHRVCVLNYLTLIELCTQFRFKTAWNSSIYRFFHASILFAFYLENFEQLIRSNIPNVSNIDLLCEQNTNNWMIHTANNFSAERATKRDILPVSNLAFVLPLKVFHLDLSSARNTPVLSVLVQRKYIALANILTHTVGTGARRHWFTNWTC